MQLSSDDTRRFRREPSGKSVPGGEPPVLPDDGSSRRDALRVFTKDDGAFERLAVHGKRPREVVADQPPKPATPVDGLIGNSLGQIKGLIERYAKADATVLITGESGTGKELAARALHTGSNRASGPFVAINCAALSPHLLESELFGHVRGAFTGADRAKPGLLVVAHGGTVFLDEIGEMPPALQVKLLRVLQDSVITPVGGTQDIKVDIRVVAATNRNLQTEMDEGRFREDLFYRLNVLEIEMPSLRDRKGDIPALAQHLLEKKVAKMGGETVPLLTNAAKVALAKHEWRGNVRELENTMERLAIVCGGKSEIDTHHVLAAIHGRMSDIISGKVTSAVAGSGPPSLVDVELASLTTSSGEIPEKGLDFNALVDNYKCRLMLLALEKTNWKVAEAARLLRIKRTTLWKKIIKYNLDTEGRLGIIHGKKSSDDGEEVT